MTGVKNREHADMMVWKRFTREAASGTGFIVEAGQRGGLTNKSISSPNTSQLLTMPRRGGPCCRAVIAIPVL